MVTRREWEKAPELDNTAKDLRTLSDRPSSTEWQKGINRWIEAATVDMQARAVQLARIEALMLGPVAVAEIVHKEMAVHKGKVDQHDRILWASLGTFFGGITVVIIGLVIAWLVKR